MAGRQESACVSHLEDPGGSHLPPRPILLVVVDLLLDLPHELLEPPRVCDLYRPRPPQCEGLNALRGHDRPHARPRSRPHQVRIYPSVSYTILGRRTGDRRLDSPVAEVSLDDLVGLIDIPPPDMPCVPELNDVVVDEDVDRLAAPADEDDLVVPGELHLGREVASCVGVSQDARLWRLCRHIKPAGRGEHGADEGARREHQSVFGTQGICSRTDQVVEHLGVESPASQELSGQILPQFARLRLLPGKVDSEDLTGVSPELSHRCPTSS